MGSLRRASGAVVCLGLVVLIGHAPARATTFVMMDERDLARAADAAVIGEVVEVDSAEDPQSRGIRTFVAVRASDVVFGGVARGILVIEELGGTVGERSEKVFGTPEYSVGEKVLVFLSQDHAGAWRTVGMAMGKYELSLDHRGTILATRAFDEGVAVFAPNQQRLATRSGRFSVPLTRLLAAVAAERPRTKRSRLRLRLAAADSLVVPEFTLLGSPSRWFEPDDHAAVEFLIDSTRRCEVRSQRRSSGGQRRLGGVELGARLEHAARRRWADLHRPVQYVPRRQPGHLQRPLRRDRPGLRLYRSARHRRLLLQR